MGHTLDEWVAKVGSLVRDSAGRDSKQADIEATGLRPAFSRFSNDRRREAVEEVVGTGSPYIPLPSGWVPGFSSLRVEFPARQDPPEFLDAQSWRITRSIANPNVAQVLLDRTPAASQFVRLWYKTSWPYPTNDLPIVDQVDDVAFEPVAALAASFVLIGLAAQAAQSRVGSVAPTNTDGAVRAQVLMDAAKAYGDLYEGFLGIGAEGNAGGGSTVPAYGSFDLDPSRYSIFHGGRR